MNGGGSTGDADDSRNRRKIDRSGEVNPPKIRVLAVDDDASYLRYLQVVLTRAGFDVFTAADGSAAIARVRDDQSIDLMLVDLAMPLMDGIETVQSLHKEIADRGLYTILLTAHDGQETKLRALDSGLDDFLTKMSSELEIVAKIRSAARRMEMERRLHHEKNTFEALALTDELTGIANRRALTRAALTFLASGLDLGVVLFDLNSFKQVNDTFGHVTGDRVLADVATSLKESTRVGDVIARYGGDEFVLLLPKTGTDEARVIAERVVNKICQLRWTIDGTVLMVSATYGLASTTSGARSLPELLGACDDQLYRGKSRRREEKKARAQI